MTDETSDVQPTDETQGEDKAPRRVYIKSPGGPITQEVATAIAEQFLAELLKAYPELNKDEAGASESEAEEEREEQE